MSGIVVTTGVKSGARERELAKAVATELGAPFVPRGGRSLAKVAQLASLSWRRPAEPGEGEGDDGPRIRGALVATTQGLNLVDLDDPDSPPLFFHPGMALNRIRRLLAGGQDHMVDAMGLAGGMKVLDCTLGMAADAIVASHVVGPEGQVVGLEVSPLVAAVVRHGLAEYKVGGAEVNAAMRRISVVNCDCRQYLAAAAPGSFDVVYFDPMFCRPVEASPGIAGLRRWACHAPIDEETFNMALRAASSAVVLKTRRYARPPAWREPDRVAGGASSTVKYLVWRTGPQDAQ